MDMPNIREYLISLIYDSSKPLSYQYVKMIPFMTEDGDIDVESKTDILYSNDMITDEDIDHVNDIVYLLDNKKILIRNSGNNPLNFNSYTIDNGIYCLHNYGIKSLMRKAGCKSRSYIDRFVHIKEPTVNIKTNKVVDRAIGHELTLDGYTYRYEDRVYKVYLLSCEFTLLCMNDEFNETEIESIFDAMVDKYGFKGYTIDKVHQPVLERLFEMGE